MRKDEIMEALKCMEVATARGRREANGRQIDWSPSGEDCKGASLQRCASYIRVAIDLRHIVVENHDGIGDKELEAVEFVIEQLEDASRKAHETALKNY